MRGKTVSWLGHWGAVLLMHVGVSQPARAADSKGAMSAWQSSYALVQGHGGLAPEAALGEHEASELGSTAYARFGMRARGGKPGARGKRSIRSNLLGRSRRPVSKKGRTASSTGSAKMRRGARPIASGLEHLDGLRRMVAARGRYAPICTAKLSKDECNELKKRVTRRRRAQRIAAKLREKAAEILRQIRERIEEPGEAPALKVKGELWLHQDNFNAAGPHGAEVKSQATYAASIRRNERLAKLPILFKALAELRQSSEKYDESLGGYLSKLLGPVTTLRLERPRKSPVVVPVWRRDLKDAFRTLRFRPRFILTSLLQRQSDGEAVILSEWRRKITPPVSLSKDEKTGTTLRLHDRLRESVRYKKKVRGAAVCRGLRAQARLVKNRHGFVRRRLVEREPLKELK